LQFLAAVDLEGDRHMDTSETGNPVSVEKRSVDWVPNEERHGKARDLGNVWLLEM